LAGQKARLHPVSNRSKPEIYAGWLKLVFFKRDLTHNALGPYEIADRLDW
jgi:hypothetical protein